MKKEENKKDEKKAAEKKNDKDKKQNIKLRVFEEDDYFEEFENSN